MFIITEKNILGRNFLPISSMTGFARQADGFEVDGVAIEWVWEVKSVNGKGLDVKTRVPYWLDEATLGLRGIAQKYFERGSISALLDVSVSQREQKVSINQSLLDELIKRIMGIYNDNQDVFSKPSLTDILALNGVVEIEKGKLDEEFALKAQKAVVESFEKACVSLQESRNSEGEKMRCVLLGQLEKIEQIVGKIATLSEDASNLMREKLALQVGELLAAANASVSEDRLAQEVVFMANRADICEEIDRLNAHIKTAAELLGSEKAVGRKLDFLCQELNRETNTTCSKSPNVEIINYGIELKTIIEQFREQVQNME